MSVLDDIVSGVLIDLEQRMLATPTDQLRTLVAEAEPALPVLSHFTGPDVAVIAEIKRASPSKGELAAIPRPSLLAAQYEIGGATAISVLTEERRFGGSLADLAAVRSAVKTPVLRKDFIVSGYQVLEARAHGADLVLLIVAALKQPALEGLIERVNALGMTALVEVHEAEEVSRALDAGATMIGVNNRNLKTLEVHREQFAKLVPLIPDHVVRIAESGIRDAADIHEYAAAGADGVLVGEALVTRSGPAAAVRELVEAGIGRRRQ